MDETASSRDRLLAAGKSLFARGGYEGTSTASIVREAGTSESQLVRYFGGKSGLLNAIFNEGWAALNETVGREISTAANGRDAILRLLNIVMTTFARDRDIAFLLLFEGRRVRGAEVQISEGFVQFSRVLEGLLDRGRKDGSLRKDIPVPVMAAALTGAAEGMVRDAILAERAGRGEAFGESSIRAVFESFLLALQ